MFYNPRVNNFYERPIDILQRNNYNQQMNNQPWNDTEQPMNRNNQRRLQNALNEIKKSVQGEREDELFYDDLINLAPNQEQKDIIKSIRDDERKHNNFLRNIYQDLTGEMIRPIEDVSYEKPTSYIDGIKKALFGELSAVERYRRIRAEMPNQYLRDILFEILTDELKHAAKYNYLYTTNFTK